MAWVESHTDHFLCRHSSGYTPEAARVLARLERLHERLEARFPRTVEGLTVVLHDPIASLALSNPLMPVLWAATERQARRYVAGWVGRHELHVLSPPALRHRASPLQGSFEMLALAPLSLYTRRVILECRHNVRHSRIPGRGLVEPGWAWLIEGAARWFSGESQHARGAIAHRLRTTRRPHFPPRISDAPLLGSTVIDLLVREEGEEAAIAMASRLDPRGTNSALSHAFRGRALANVEAEWRHQLSRMVQGPR